MAFSLSVNEPNFYFMISMKGILYTVIGAAASAALVGTILTRGKRGENLRAVGSKVQNLLGNREQTNETVVGNS